MIARIVTLLFIILLWVIKAVVEEAVVNLPNLWDIILGLIVVLLIISIPWKQIWSFVRGRAKQYFYISIWKIDLLGLLSSEPYIELYIEFENKSNFGIEIKQVNGSLIYEVINKFCIPCVVCKKNKSVVAKGEIIYPIKLVVNRDTANSLLKFHKGASNILWYLDLSWEVTISPLSKSYSFEKPIGKYEMFPPLLSFELDKINNEV